MRFSERSRCAFATGSGCLQDVWREADDWHITALGQVDDNRIPGARAIVILLEARPKPSGFRSHDGIGLGVVGRFAPEDLDADHGFFQFLKASVEMPLHDEPEKSGQPFITGKARTLQHLLELSPD